MCVCVPHPEQPHRGGGGGSQALCWASLRVLFWDAVMGLSVSEPGSARRRGQGVGLRVPVRGVLAVGVQVPVRWVLAVGVLVVWVLAM